MLIKFNESQKHNQLYSYSPKRESQEGEYKMSEDWIEVVAGNVFVFQQEGDTIEGVLVKKREGKKYDNMVYDIETKDGLKTIFGTAILDTRMENVAENTPVKIEYIGEIKTGTGRLAKNFKIWTRETKE